MRKFKSGRQKNFKLLIFSDFTRRSKMKRLILTVQNIKIILEISNFVTQSLLEQLLYKLTIMDNGRTVELQNFKGQLEEDPLTGMPVWKILLETTTVTTGRKIKEEFLKSSQRFLNSPIDIGNIKIKSIDPSEDLSTDARLILKTTDWYPGFFSKSTVLLSVLLQEKIVQQSIQESPEKYRVLLETKTVSEDVI